ncbi:MAG: hypothetical protein ACLVJH_14190 [Faecalibacterium prausnitzii]
MRDGWRFDGGWPEAERRVLCLEPEYSYPASVRCAAYSCKCRALPGARAARAQGLSGQPDGACASSARRWAISCCLPMRRARPMCSRWNRRQSLSVGSCVRRDAQRCPPRLLEPEEIPAFSAPERQLLTATVSSLRLDAVLSAMLHVSRGTAAELIERGQGRDQPSAGRKAPCSRIRAGCVHRARQEPLPADCVAREK